MNEQIVQMLWAQIWQVSLLILVMAGLTRVLMPRYKQVAYLLWIVVIIKCVTPPIWSSELGVFSWAQRGCRTVAASQWTTWAQLFTSDAFGELAPVKLDFGQRFSAELNQELESQSRTPAEIVQGVVVGCWLLGGLLCFLKSWRQWQRLDRLARIAQVPTPLWFVNLVEQVAQRVGLKRRVRIIVTDQELGPLMVGVWQPTLVVPSRMMRSDQSHRLQPVVAHELVHARRVDTLVGWLQSIAQCVWWFHPLVWYANHQTTRLCEQSCDAEVIGRLGCLPKFYAACLIESLEGRPVARRGLALASSVRQNAVTKDRIQALVGSRRNTYSRTPLWAWPVFGVLAMVVLPGAERFTTEEQVTRLLAKAEHAFLARRWDEAIQLYSHVIRRDAAQGQAWFRLGFALHSQGRLDAAIAAHRKASEFDSFRGVAKYNWSCALSLQNQPDAAMAKLAEAIDDGFRSRRPIDADPDFEALRGDDTFRSLAQRAQLPTSPLPSPTPTQPPTTRPSTTQPSNPPPAVVPVPPALSVPAAETYSR